MKPQFIISAFFVVLSLNISYSQVKKFGFDKLLSESPNAKIPFAVVNDGSKTYEALAKRNIKIKHLNKEWVYVTTTPAEIQYLIDEKLISNFHFEFHKAVDLNDSTRVKHFVDAVHSGSSGLPLPFTGKDVIIGVIDSGLDINHPDFIDANGNSRVLYYWDQTMPDTGIYVVPQPFNYGLEFSNSQIQNGSLDLLTFGTSHGTNSAGIAAGNGLANGENKGMAPDSKIIFVNYANFSTAFADACDYIFRKADEAGLPCVINISAGFYLGSHDGNDPATEYIEDLLDEKPGRIISVSAGNSGAYAPYHVKADVTPQESFVWFENNPNTSPYTGTTNTIIFDLWADSADIVNVEFAFGANLSSGSFSERGTTIFRNSQQNLNGIINDTIRNANGTKLAILEIYPTKINQLYNLQVLYKAIDSTAYYYSIKARGNGNYDLWSSTGAGISLNKIVTNIPSPLIFPAITNYHLPDLDQSIVSGFACSEKVITVGNVVNLTDYIDVNGNLVTLPAGFFSNQLSPNSSKGPNRLGSIKPDITAAGDYSFSAATLSNLANPGFANKVSQGGWHGRAGGTSASSPVVAGIAALYFERCGNATYQDFMTDMKNAAFTDQFTGSVPSNSFGYGKIHALNTLLQRNYSSEIIGNTLICAADDSLSIDASVPLDSIVWGFNGTTSTGTSLNITNSGEYFSFTYDNKACVETDTISVILGTILTAPVISNNGGVLTATSSPNYQWYQNGNMLSGQTFQTLIGNFNPNVAYTVSTSSNDGCIVFSQPFGINSIDEKTNKINIFPNPSAKTIEIIGLEKISKITIIDFNGKSVLELESIQPSIDVSKLNKGIYFVRIESEKDLIFTKFERL
jgi:hypothetical protein